MNSICNFISSSSEALFSFPLNKERARRVALVALSALAALAMVAAYIVGAPWFVPLTFFCLCLAPLFHLGKIKDN
jgi:hypothetical protein